MHASALHPRILSAATALPQHHVMQEDLIEAFCGLWRREHESAEKVRRLQEATRVKARYLSLPLDLYQELESFAQANEVWRETAISLAERALLRALREAGLEASAIDHLFLISSTGIATPSLDATLANRLSLSREVRRTPIFGLGCAGGVAGLSRASDWLRGREEGLAAVVAVELCSLTFQRSDLSLANAIASGLFGDGAAALLVGAGPEREGPAVVAASSRFYPDTEHLMGWDVVETGLRIRLSPGIPRTVDAHVREDMDRFLAAQGLRRADIGRWVCHPGGPRVLEAIERALELTPAQTAPSWRLLEEMGNLSSVSVLVLLDALLQEDPPKKGDMGVAFALGPGFSSEFALLRW